MTDLSGYEEKLRGVILSLTKSLQEGNLPLQKIEEALQQSNPLIDQLNPAEQKQWKGKFEMLLNMAREMRAVPQEPAEEPAPQPPPKPAKKTVETRGRKKGKPVPKPPREPSEKTDKPYVAALRKYLKDMETPYADYIDVVGKHILLSRQLEGVFNDFLPLLLSPNLRFSKYDFENSRQLLFFGHSVDVEHPSGPLPITERCFRNTYKNFTSLLNDITQSIEYYGALTPEERLVINWISAEELQKMQKARQQVTKDSNIWVEVRDSSKKINQREKTEATLKKKLKELRARSNERLQHAREISDQWKTLRSSKIEIPSNPNEPEDVMLPLLDRLESLFDTSCDLRRRFLQINNAIKNANKEFIQTLTKLRRGRAFVMALETTQDKIDASASQEEEPSEKDAPQARSDETPARSVFYLFKKIREQMGLTHKWLGTPIKEYRQAFPQKTIFLEDSSLSDTKDRSDKPLQRTDS